MVTWKLKASTFVPAFNVGGSPHVVVERRHRSPMANSNSKKSYGYAETGAGVVLPRSPVPGSPRRERTPRRRPAGAPDIGRPDWEPWVHSQGSLLFSGERPVT